MRDYVLTALIFGSLPICLVRPWLGFVVWYWFGLMCPHRMTWNFAYSMPFAAFIGGTTLVGMFFAKDRKPIPWNRELVLIVALLAYFTFTTLFAWAPQTAWPQLEKLFKIILMTVLSTMFIYGRNRITVIMFTIALSLGFYGVKGAIHVVTSGGAGQVKGPEGSFLDGNTFVGVAMIMVLPLILHLARDDQRPWVKRSLYAMFAMTIVAIIFTTSRGAYLGLAAVLPLMFLGAKRRWIAILAIASALMGAQFLPEHIFRRAELIENYQQDGSANQRLQAWTVAWNIAKEYPLTGAGFEFEYAPDNERWLSYGDRGYDWAINHSSAAHSIYFQVLGQHGFVALGLFLALLIGTVLKLGRIARTARKREGMTWLASYATAVQIALVGYMVSGAFLSLAYFDLAFLYYALAAVFARELKGDEEALAAAAASTQVSLLPQRSP
jgi:probable O-glycosylation ligase (exosortase A-associated)